MMSRLSGRGIATKDPGILSRFLSTCKSKQASKQAGSRNERIPLREINHNQWYRMYKAQGAAGGRYGWWDWGLFGN